MAADGFRADPVALHCGSKQISGAVEEAAFAFLSHDSGLTEAAHGWIGSSQQALNELAAHWWSRHERHKLAGAELGHGVSDAAVRYASNETASRRAFEALVSAPDAR